MWNWVGQLEQLQRTGRPVAVVTVVGCSNSTPREVGAKMLVDAERFFGTIGGGRVEEMILADARACLAAGSTRTFRYPLGAKAGQCCGGVMDVLVETLNSGPNLVLFGAGHVGQALCQVLEGTPFTVDLVDERPEWLHREGLPASVRRHEEAGEDFIATARLDPERTYVAIMTHQHDLDQALVAALLDKPLRYLGLIGSKAKWHRFRSRLEQRGVTAEQLDRVRCPIGLPIGGKSPREVAISVAAELLQQLHRGAAKTSEATDAR
jgi:xanthine dehydrogenase accessory factor